MAAGEGHRGRDHGDGARAGAACGLDAANARICAAGLTPAQATVIGGSERNLPVAEINRRLVVVASLPAAGARVPRGARSR